MEAFLVGLVLFLYGTFVSWVEERFGKFQDLPPTAKQAINSVLALIVPAVVVWVAPYWRPEFGVSSDVVTALLLLIAPVFVWLVSQVAHHFDPARWGTGVLLSAEIPSVTEVRTVDAGRG